MKDVHLFNVKLYVIIRYNEDENYRHMRFHLILEVVFFPLSCYFIVLILFS